MPVCVCRRGNSWNIQEPWCSNVWNSLFQSWLYRTERILWVLWNQATVAFVLCTLYVLLITICLFVCLFIWVCMCGGQGVSSSTHLVDSRNQTHAVALGVTAVANSSSCSECGNDAWQWSREIFCLRERSKHPWSWCWWSTEPTPGATRPHLLYYGRKIYRCSANHWMWILVICISLHSYLPSKYQISSIQQRDATSGKGHRIELRRIESRFCHSV